MINLIINILDNLNSKHVRIVLQPALIPQKGQGKVLRVADGRLISQEAAGEGGTASEEVLDLEAKREEAGCGKTHQRG